MVKLRSAYYCNLKLLLIFLVILGLPRGKWAVLALSLLLGCLSGRAAWIGRTLSLSRSVDSYGCIEGGSCVFFDITVTQGTRVLEGEIQIHTKDGKIDVAGISHQPGVQWLDAIDRALYPSAHSGY